LGVDFPKLATRSGTARGAGPLFEQPVKDIVAIGHPEVRSITARPASERRLLMPEAVGTSGQLAPRV
jgi:hypothetical protein